MLAPGAGLQLSINNSSALNPEQVSAFSHIVEEELRDHGHTVSHSGSSEAFLKVSLSQNLTSLLAIGELVQDNRTRVAVEGMELTSLNLATANPSRGITLSSEPLWKQNSPLLDLKFLIQVGDGAEHLAVLSADELSLHQKNEDGWSLLKSFPLRGRPAARDPRGELFQIKEGSGFLLVAGIPGSFCFLALDSASNPASMECNSNAGNPLLGASLVSLGPHVPDNRAKWDFSHNYYSGELLGHSGNSWKIDPFYAATFYIAKTGEAQDVVIVAGLDALLHVVSRDRKELRTLTDWGSELTAVHSDCDHGWYVLATGKGDWTADDRITAFQLEKGSVRGSDSFVELPGPVLSLGSEQVPTEGEVQIRHEGAIAVIRNTKSGEYEAYRISIACGRDPA